MKNNNWLGLMYRRVGRLWYDGCKTYKKVKQSAFIFSLCLSLILLYVNGGTVLAVQPADLVAYWNFDEGNGTVVNDSASNDLISNNGTVDAATWIAGGLLGSSLGFNGSSKVTVANSSELNITSQITVSIWFRLDQAIKNQTNAYPLFFHNQGSNMTSGYILYANKAANTVNFRILNASGPKDASFNADGLSCGRWYNLVGTYNGSVLRIYLDSQLKGSYSYTGSIAITNNVYEIGTALNGALDEAKIYKAALNDKEIYDNYKSVKNPASEGESPRLAGYWPLDEGAGQIANDVTIDDSTQDNGNISGAAWVANGITGSALRFNGTINNYMVVNNSSELNITEQITLSIWFRLDMPIQSQASACPVFFSNSDSNYRGYAMLANKAANTINFRVLNGTMSYMDAYFDASNLITGQWYNLVGTYDGNTVKIYLNSELKDSRVYSGLISITSRDYEVGTNFQGSLDELRIYKGALNTDEVAGIYKGINNIFKSNTKLYQTPNVQWVDGTGPDYSLIYDNTEYQGSMARVFAYYSVPNNLQPGQKVPAVVLIHGGGGQAYQSWAQQWAGYGYAAIAIDLFGNDQNGNLMPDGRPVDYSCNITQAGLTDAWQYHAASAVIRAISFLGSRPEVDSDNIGAIGISWGAFTLCNVLGVDNRLAAAVPVYGCGYIYQNSVWQDLGYVFSQPWIDNLDPHNYLSNSNIPLYWVASNNDGNFPLDIHEKSYKLTNGTCKIRTKTNMVHDYPPVWYETPEIKVFLDSYLKSGTPLLKIVDMGYTDSESTVWARYQPSATGISSAKLVYTTEPLWSEKYGYNGNATNWGEVNAVIDTVNNKISATVMTNVSVMYLNAYDGNNNLVSTQFINNFKTGFESGDIQPSWVDSSDGSINVSSAVCHLYTGITHTGNTSLLCDGIDNSSSASCVYFKVFSVNIPIAADTKLSYWIRPQQALGRYVAVDFHCTDGTTLRDSGAVDQNGYSMHPTSGHGGLIPLASWSQIKCNVGQWLNGKTVDKIWIAYDHPTETGGFTAIIDDILITNNTSLP